MSQSLPLVQPASKPCAGLQPSTSSNCLWENINIPKHIYTQTPSHTLKKNKRTVNRERGTAERTGDKAGGWVTQRDKKKKKQKTAIVPSSLAAPHRAAAMAADSDTPPRCDCSHSRIKSKHQGSARGGFCSPPPPASLMIG